MIDLLPLARQAFRKLYGLPSINGEPVFSPASLDVQDLLGVARRHRVMGLLEAGLSLSKILPAADARTWRDAAYGQFRHSSERLQEAEELFPLLEGRIGPVLLIKGPTLAVQAWPDPALRSFDDIDMRIPRAHFDALIPVMRNFGYETGGADERELYHRWQFGWGLSFTNRRGGIIEFNHRFFPPHFPVPRRFYPMNAALAEYRKLDQIHVRSLAPHSHLVYACMHAFWHGWERLSWLVDIAGLMVRHPEAMARAEEAIGRVCFARKCLHAGAGMAGQLFGHGVLQSSIDHDVQPEIDQALQRLRSHQPYLSIADQRLRHRPLMNRMDKICYELQRVLVPGDGDFRAITYPRGLGWLYWPTRPVRYLRQKRQTR